MTALLLLLLLLLPLLPLLLTKSIKKLNKKGHLYSVLFCLYLHLPMKRLAAYFLAFALMLSASEKAFCQNSGPGDGRELHFSISPNPVNGTYVLVNFSEASFPKGQVQLSITNVIGQSLFSHIINQSDVDRGSIRIEIADLKLSKGLYFVKMSSGEHSFTQKLVLR